MQFTNPLRRPQQASTRRDKCEVVVEKTAKGIKKSIRGNCNREQLEALAKAQE